MSRINYNPPIRSDVHCRNCGQEIEAVARIVGDLEIHGIHEYEWRHVWNGSPLCVKTYNAEPYDGWSATAKIEGAIKLDAEARAEEEL